MKNFQYKTVLEITNFQQQTRTTTAPFQDLEDRTSLSHGCFPPLPNDGVGDCPPLSVERAADSGKKTNFRILPHFPFPNCNFYKKSAKRESWPPISNRFSKKKLLFSNFESLSHISFPFIRTEWDLGEKSHISTI